MACRPERRGRRYGQTRSGDRRQARCSARVGAGVATRDHFAGTGFGSAPCTRGRSRFSPGAAGGRAARRTEGLARTVPVGHRVPSYRGGGICQGGPPSRAPASSVRNHVRGRNLSPWRAEPGRWSSRAERLGGHESPGLRRGETAGAPRVARCLPRRRIGCTVRVGLKAGQVSLRAPVRDRAPRERRSAASW
jgi:hypothetical protein